MEEKFLYNNQVLRERRKDLRINQTEAERLLWSQLRDRQLRGYKFLRQYSVGPYILDFYCARLRLAIELDGSQHKAKESKLYDEDRTDYLNTLNIKVIRLWNHEVEKNLSDVLNRISPLLI